MFIPVALISNHNTAYSLSPLFLNAISLHFWVEVYHLDVRGCIYSENRLFFTVYAWLFFSRTKIVLILYSDTFFISAP